VPLPTLIEPATVVFEILTVLSFVRLQSVACAAFKSQPSRHTVCSSSACGLKRSFRGVSREAGAVDPSHTGLLFRCDCLGFEHASLREPFVAADVGRSMTGSTLSGCSTARWCTARVGLQCDCAHARLERARRSTRLTSTTRFARVVRSPREAQAARRFCRLQWTTRGFVVQPGELCAVRAAGATESALCLCAPLLR